MLYPEMAAFTVVLTNSAGTYGPSYPDVLGGSPRTLPDSHELDERVHERLYMQDRDNLSLACAYISFYVSMWLILETENGSRSWQIHGPKSKILVEDGLFDQGTGRFLLPLLTVWKRWWYVPVTGGKDIALPGRPRSSPHRRDSPMKHSLHLLSTILAASVLLTACDGGITDTRTHDAQQPRFNLPVDDGSGGDGGGGGGGGGTTTDPFAPGTPPYYQADLPMYAYGTYGELLSCGQVTHAFWGFSNDVTAGTTIYVTGVVVAHSQMVWGIYNQAGVRVAYHVTNSAGSNCVVAHEPEGISTAGWAPGYYYLYSSYNGLSMNGITQTSYGYSTPYPGKYIGAMRVR